MRVEQDASGGTRHGTTTSFLRGVAVLFHRTRLLALVLCVAFLSLTLEAKEKKKSEASPPGPLPEWVATVATSEGPLFGFRVAGAPGIAWAEPGDRIAGYRVQAPGGSADEVRLSQGGHSTVFNQKGALALEDQKRVAHFSARLRLRDLFLAAQRHLAANNLKSVRLGDVPGLLGTAEKGTTLERLEVAVGTRQLACDWPGLGAVEVNCIKVKTVKGDSATRLAGRYGLVRGDLLMLNSGFDWGQLKRGTEVWVLPRPRFEVERD